MAERLERHPALAGLGAVSLSNLLQGLGPERLHHCVEDPDAAGVAHPRELARDGGGHLGRQAQQDGKRGMRHAGRPAAQQSVQPLAGRRRREPDRPGGAAGGRERDRAPHRRRWW